MNHTTDTTVTATVQPLPTLPEDVRTTLIADKGTSYTDYQGLLRLPEPPQPTDTWTPIPHWLFAMRLDEIMQESGLQGHSWQYAVSHDASKLFGTVKIRSKYLQDQHLAEHPDMELALGFRTSNDKSMAISLTAGRSVFVCSNMISAELRQKNI